MKSDFLQAYTAGKKSVTGFPVWFVALLAIVAIVIGKITRHYALAWYVNSAIWIIAVVGMAKLLSLVRKYRKESPAITQ